MAWVKGKEGSNGHMQPSQWRLTFLDAGIAVEMDPQDKRNFMDLFCAIAKGEGGRFCCVSVFSHITISYHPYYHNLIIDMQNRVFLE